MLSIATVRAASPAARPYKMTDGGGLHLFVTPNGHRSWRARYRHRGSEKLVVLGSFPDVGLHEARQLRDQFRERLRNGVELTGKQVRERKLEGGIAAADETFEQLARRWHQRRAPRWSAEHAADVLASLERDVFPAIGAKRPSSIEATDVLELLLKVEARGRIETARRLRERISGVFRFGIPLRICNADPAALISDELSPRPVQVPQAAITELDQLRQFLTDVAAVPAPIVVVLAHRILALTAVRLATLRGARWDELGGIPGLDASGLGKNASSECNYAFWRIPPARLKLTKVRKANPAAEHIIPLSRQAVAAIRILYAATGDGELLFPGRHSGRPIGEGAIGELYDDAGYAGRHVPHGWRASFSTILNDRCPADRSLIDQALAHIGAKGRVEAAYNRSQQLERTADLFQRWADLIMPRDGQGEAER
jgi:integrase